MRRFHSLVGILCLSALIGQSLAGDLVITKISISDPKTPEVSFKVAEADAPVGTKFALNIGIVADDSSSQKEYLPIEVYVATSDVIVFTFDITDHELTENSYITFDLTGTKGSEQKVKASVQFQKKATILDLTAQWIGKSTKKVHRNTLRIQENVDGYKLCGEGITDPKSVLTCKKGGAGPCYAVNIGVSVTGELSVCLSSDDTTPVPVVLKTFGSISAAADIGTPPTEIVLNYKTQALSITDQLTVTDEALLYKDTKVQICAKGNTCTNTTFVSGSSSANLILFIEGGVRAAAGTSEYVIQDFDLKTYDLGNTVLEARWNFQTGLNEYISVREFVEGNDVEAGPSYHTANVDCTFNEGFCYAYYVNVNPDTTYKISVHPKNPLNTISDEKKMPSLKSSSIMENENRAIHAEPIDITVTESNIVLDVCFTYITNTSNINTHYEFLAINSKGKWKKEIVNKKKDNSHACFHGLEVPLADFSEGSKFLVLLRDSDNGKPLASGEVTLDLPALRAIKPEVDNGNNGSTSTLAIVGAAIAGIACLMALVAAAVMFVMKINRNNDGLQYPLQHNNIEDSSTIHGLDNSIPTM